MVLLPDGTVPPESESNERAGNMSKNISRHVSEHILILTSGHFASGPG
jgi:hypothetical protein